MNYLRFSWFIYVYIEHIEIVWRCSSWTVRIFYSWFILLSLFGRWKHEMQIIPWGLDGSTRASRRSACWCKWSVSCISPILCWCKPHEICIVLYTDDYINIHKYRSYPSYPTWTYLYAFPFWCMLQPFFRSAQCVAKRGLGSLFAIATFHGHLGCQMQRVIDMTHQKWGYQWGDGGFHKWGYPKMDGYLGKSY